MSAQFLMFAPETLPVTPKRTSLRGSRSGRSHSDKPAGTTHGLFGPGRAPANLSPRQAAEEGLLTSGTSGRTGTTSLRSAALQSSLESRLRAKMASHGSTLFKLTWKDRATPSGRLICALRASGRCTSDSDSGSWPTPNARDGRDLSLTGTVCPAWFKRKSYSTVVLAYLRGYTPDQIVPLYGRLMGLPDAWTQCAPTATRSTRKPRQPSSDP